MIIYVTKQTFERFKLKMPEDLMPPMNTFAQSIISQESGDRLCEWGGKLFYFDRRKCIQLANFASKFTLFLFDIKLDDLPKVGNCIAEYLLDLYSTDQQMIKALMQMFAKHPLVCISRLKDRSIISTLNTTQNGFADDGYRFYDFISNGILHTREINKAINFDWMFTMKNNGKTEYFSAGVKFRELVMERFGR